MLAWWKTRSLIVIKNIVFSYLFLLCLFMLLILNMGFPPFLGFLSEILMLKSFILRDLLLVILILGVLFRCYYNIYLFWCFTRFTGIIFKLNFFCLDLFIFLLLRLFLNF
jgi:formate hydrogenlyase subunit 3/multisubunit Na+/H+ antiporter MnhD subunit